MRSISRRNQVLGFCAALVLALAGTVFAANDAHVRQLRETGSCPGCDLTDALIGTVGLDGADLSGANLSNAVLYASSLRGANLSGAVLNGTDLKMADLTGAVGAELSGALTDERTTCPSGDHGPCN